MQPNDLNRRAFLKHGALLGSGSVAILRAYAADPDYVVAETSFGKVRGMDSAGIKVFKGIPYGGTTTGSNRFMPPVDPTPWPGVRDALQYGPSAPQSDPAARGAASNGPSESPRENEDCLVLNVWTPAIHDGRKRPVMFWVHGGGFRGGSGSSATTDGTRLARRGDVVVVSLNHRLNVLGFSYLEEFGGPAFAQSGDVGMLDIVHALKWVRGNIAQFGGDPNTVMIFGQSGGGRKVETLLAMPSAKGLFHRAVAESGATVKLVERDQATRIAARLLAELGLDKSQVRELQKIPLDRLMVVYHKVERDIGALSHGDYLDTMTYGFDPTVDGKVLPRHPFYPDASRVNADVPLVIGFTRTEMTAFLAGDAAAFSLDQAAMQQRVRHLVGKNADALIRSYEKANPGSTPSDIYFLIASDFNFGAPILKITERRAALNSAPVYAYYFRWKTPVDNGRMRTPHALEVPFVFDNVKVAARSNGGGPDAVALADKMSDAWIAFARTGKPDTPKLPHWSAYNVADRATMVFDNTSKIEKDPIREQRLAMFSALSFT